MCEIKPECTDMEKRAIYFLQIVESGSFKQAAEVLKVQQPSLTVAIKKLENEMGVTLFTRHAQGVSLTASGELYKEYLQEQQQKQLELIHRLQDIQQREYGRIKLGCGEAWWKLFVQDAIKPFLTHSYLLSFGNHLQLLQQLKRQELDFFIGHEVVGLSPDIKVRFIPLVQDREAIYVRSSHPLYCSNNTVICGDDLESYPLLRVTAASSRDLTLLTTEQKQSFLRYEQERSQERICYDVDNLSAGLDILRETDAIMPYTSRLRSWLGEQNIACLDIEHPIQGTVGIYLNAGGVSSKIEAVIQAIQECADIVD